MLKAITIENFKSFGKKQSLPLAPLTLMIGANASGKSNAIEAFRFLSFLAEGQKLSVLQHNIDDSNRIFRGSSHDLGHNGSEEFTLGCEIDDSDWDKFFVTLGNDEGLFIVQEKISSDNDNVPLYLADRFYKKKYPEHNLEIIYNDFKENKKYFEKDYQFLSSDQVSLISDFGNLGKLANFTDSAKAQKIIPKVIKIFRVVLEKILFIDPVPSKMRGDSVPEKILRNDCSNLAGVLQVLCEDPEQKALLLQFIKSLPEQNFTDIKFYDDRRGRYFFELIETFGGKERPCLSELLSDGTLRVLAVAAALLSAPEGSTVVIEEIDNGIHPSRARDLMALMLERAKQRNIRLLLTTHNPALMDALPDEALGDVVFSYRDPEDGDSRLVRLSDLDDYASLVLQGPLGDLVTQGVVDRFVKNPVSPEDKKEKAEEWLALMQGTKE